MTQMSLRQPSLDLSPGSSSPILEDDEISVIPRTPPRGRTNTSRNLLPIFSSSTGPRETLRGPSVSTEDLVNQLPGWYDSDGYNSSLSTPSSVTSGRRSSLGKRSYTPATTGSSSGSPGSSVSSADNSLLKEILKEVRASNQKVADLEKKLQDIQEAEYSGKVKRKKIAPSPEVRMTVRKVYRTLEEEDENFGWNIGAGFADKANQDVANTLVTEVKTHLPDVPSVTIKDAARTYFNSVSGVSRLKTSGKYAAKIALQRRKNRLMRKLKRRQAAFFKTNALNQAQKEKWALCVVAEMMSSEESDDDDGDEESTVFVVRPLPWRSDKVNSFFSSLDTKFSKNQSKKSAMMTIHRSKGLPSDRPRPSSVPDWALKP